MGKKIQFIGRYALEGHLLGKGSFARVELAHHSVTGCKVAIKIIDTRKVKEEYQKSNIQREARILGQLRHPNIVRLYETLKATTLHCLVLEYASGGELQAFIKLQKDFRLSEERGRPYIRQLVSALHYLHERGVAHRDLKMENIMLDTPKINVKLVDFGLSNTFSKEELMKTHCGSPEYAAPELFTAGGKYGLEIDVWSLGIVMYALLVGKLPFTTPYTDQYRRQKLVQQMEKGLVDMHDQEMGHLSPDCQDLLHKVIEPSPSLRMPLSDMEIHPWFTENSKKPFFPFHSFPRDRLMKAQTFEELAIALDIKREVLEQKVAEDKSDEMSAMFNMILDRKRQQQGYFDVDHTVKSVDKRDAKGKRAKHDKSKGKKHAHKGPPELILPTDDQTAESAPHSGNEPEHETKFSSFDFLALCSTPTWLGPERRKSRRRSRSPMPTSIQHGAQGLSLRNQMKRDYLERQAIEMEREIIKEEKAAAASLLNNNDDAQQQKRSQNYNDHHTPVGTSLSVPGTNHASSYQNTFRRSSSLKISRRRALSCGPSQKHLSSCQSSGSVDNRDSGALSSDVDIKTPSSSGEPCLQRGSMKTLSLKIKRSSSIGRSSMAALRKRSMDFIDSLSKSFLGVPNCDNKKTLLTLPTSGSSNSLTNIPESGIDVKNHLQIPSIHIGSNPRLCVSNNESSDHSLSVTSESPSRSRHLSSSKEKQSLKEVHIDSLNGNTNLDSQFLPFHQPLGVNGPLTQVEIHCGDSVKREDPTEVLQPSSFALHKKVLGLHNSDLDKLTDIHESNSFVDISPETGKNPNSFCVDVADKLSLGDVMIQNRYQQLSLVETPLLLHKLQPVSNLSLSDTKSKLQDNGAVVMQTDIKSKLLCNLDETHMFHDVDKLGLASPDVDFDLDHHFNELILSSECLEENDDRVDSLTELISDSFRNDILPNARCGLTSAVDINDTHKVSKHSSSNMTDYDHLILKNFNKSSASGRKLSAGRLKSPSTPTWLSLRTPLARVDSFHSDDFEFSTDSDNDEQCSASSASAHTPTLSCFAHKHHALPNKQSKVKYNGSTKQNVCGCGSIQNNDLLASKLNRNLTDKKQSSLSCGHVRQDAAAMDPLLSSGSETEHHEELQEKFGSHGKSKVHPMGTADKNSEALTQPETKYLSYNNAVTRQPNQIMNVLKPPKVVPEAEQGTKKNAFIKHLAWRKNFAQFLKRKRYQSPIVSMTPPQHQQIHKNNRQQPSLGLNNNNDLAHTGPVSESRNGISPLNQLQTKTMDISPGTDDLLVTSQDLDQFKMAASTLSQVPMENIVTELMELQSSPKVQIPPSPSRGVDFSMFTESPKMKSSCLLGWSMCQNCASDDLSSEEENDSLTAGDPKLVALNAKPLAENNVSGNVNCSQLYKT